MADVIDFEPEAKPGPRGATGPTIDFEPEAKPVGTGSTIDFEPEEAPLRPARSFTVTDNAQPGDGAPIIPQPVSAGDVLQEPSMLQRIRNHPAVVRLLGEPLPEVREQQQAMGGGNVTPMDVINTGFKFASIPPQAAGPMRKGNEWLSKKFLPDELGGIEEGAVDAGLNFPIAAAPVAFGEKLGTTLLGVFSGDYVLQLPEQKAAFDQAMAAGDKRTAYKIATSAILNGAILGVGGAHEVGRLTGERPTSNAQRPTSNEIPSADVAPNEPIRLEQPPIDFVPESGTESSNAGGQAAEPVLETQADQRPASPAPAPDEGQRLVSGTSASQSSSTSKPMATVGDVIGKKLDELKVLMAQHQVTADTPADKPATIVDQFTQELRGNAGVDKGGGQEQSAETAATSPETSTVRTAAPEGTGSSTEERTGSVLRDSGMTAEEGSGPFRSDVAADSSTAAFKLQNQVDGLVAAKKPVPAAFVDEQGATVPAHYERRGSYFYHTEPKQLNAAEIIAQAHAERPPDLLDDVLNVIGSGGRISLDSMRQYVENYKPRGAEAKWFTKAGERGGHKMDDILNGMQREGVGHGFDADSFANKLADVVDGRSEWRRNIFKNHKRDRARLETKEQQAVAFERAARAPGKGKEALAADALNIGDQFTLEGALVKVTDVHLDDETHEVKGVTLEDGRMFGEQTIEPGRLLQVDEGSLQRKAAPKESENAPFSLKRNPQTETPEFKRWSKNLPEVTASKPLPRTGGWLKAFHGTPDADFESFRAGTHFTEDPEYAVRYTHPSASSINVRAKRGESPATYPVYIKTEHPFDTRNPQERQLYEREFLNKFGNGTPLSERGLPDWTDSRDLLDWLDEKGLKYDSVVLDEGGTPEGGWRGVSVVTREAVQIKSATGNRGTFDPANPDIRMAKKEEGPRSATGPTRKVDVEAAVRPLTEQMPGARVKVVQSESELPRHLQKQIRSQGAEGRVEGVFDPETGKVHLIADNLESPQRAREVFLHETVGHLGIRKLMGGDFNGFMDGVFAGQWKSELMKSVVDDYGFDLTDLEDRRHAAEEVVARLAEQPELNPTLWQRVVASVKQWLRKVGISSDVSESEIRVMLSKAKKGLSESEGESGAAARFSLGDEIDDTAKMVTVDTQTGKIVAEGIYKNRRQMRDGAERRNIAYGGHRYYVTLADSLTSKARFSLGGDEGRNERPEWLSKEKENEVWRTVRDLVKAGDTPDHAMRAAFQQLEGLPGFEHNSARRWATSLKPMLEEIKKAPSSKLQAPTSNETAGEIENRKSKIENTDGPRSATGPTTEQPDWQPLREKVNAASEKLQQAIREHQEPGKYGKTKTQALAAKNLAGAEYRNARAELNEHPGYINHLFDLHDALVKRLREMGPDHPKRSELEFQIESVQDELSKVDKSVVQKVSGDRMPEQLTRSEEAAGKNLEDVAVDTAPREGTRPTDDELPENRTKRLMAELPGRVREVFQTARELQQKLRRTISTGDNRDVIAATKDAADTIGNRIGAQAGNLVRHELNRAFGESDISTRNDVREWALTAVIESGVDRETLAEHRRGIEMSDNRNSVAARQWLSAAKYAERHWDKLAGVAETYKKITDTENAVENEAGIPTIHREGGYVFHLQDVTPNWAGMDLSAGGTGPSAPFRHIRDHATYADSIASGVKPQTLNAVDLLQHRVALGRKLIGYRGWIESMGRLVDPTSDRPVLMEPIVRKRADGTSDTTAPSGYKLESFAGQTVAVHAGYDGLFKALTGESGLSAGGWQATLKAAQTAKHVMLVFDSYHLGRLAYFGAFARGAGEGALAWLPGRPGYKRGLTLLDNTAADIRAMAEAGDIPKEWVNDLTADRALLDRALKHGLNVGHAVDNMYNDWVKHLPIAGKFNQWLFGQFQRGAMTEVSLIEMKRQAKSLGRELTDGEVRKIAKDLNVRFGNLGSQGVLKSRTAQDLARLFLLAPSWNESLIRAEVGAYRQIGAAVKDAATGKMPRMGVLGRAAIAAAASQFLANQVINMITRGTPTWQNPEEEFGAKFSAWIPDVVGGSSGFFLNPFTLPTEMTHYAMKSFSRTGDATKTMKEFLSGRLQPVSRAGMTLFTREDETGAKLRTGNEVALQMLSSAAPVPLSSGAIARAGKQLVTGQPEEKFPGQFQKQMAQTMGLKLDTAPSPEQRVRNLAKQFNDAKGIKPSAEFYHGDYYFIDRAALVGNKRELAKEIATVLEKKTPEDLAKHYRRWMTAPFTGSAAREGEFIKTLSAEQRAAYDQARTKRQALASTILSTAAQARK